jgi:PAS domain-containing protein
VKEWIDNPILWYTRLHLDDRTRWTEEFSRTVSLAKAFKGDYRFITKNGRVVWIHGEAKVVRDASGRPIFVQGIGYDITERKGGAKIPRFVGISAGRRRHRQPGGAYRAG